MQQAYEMPLYAASIGIAPHLERLVEGSGFSRSTLQQAGKRSNFLLSQLEERQ